MHAAHAVRDAQVASEPQVSRSATSQIILAPGGCFRLLHRLSDESSSMISALSRRMLAARPPNRAVQQLGRAQRTYMEGVLAPAECGIATSL